MRSGGMLKRFSGSTALFRGLDLLVASLCSAIATYALVATASRVIDDEGFALLNVWIGVLTFGVVVAFSPVEALAPRIVGFGDGHGVPRTASRQDVSSLAAVALGLSVIVVAIGAYPLASTLFDGAYSALAILVPALMAYAFQSTQKGLAVAERQTRVTVRMQVGFAVAMGVALIVIVAVPGTHFAVYFMAAAITAVIVSVTLGWIAGLRVPRIHFPLASPTAVWRDGGSLVVSAAATQTMTIAPVPVFAYLAPTDLVGIGILAGTLLICRVPTMVMVPVNALLISRMTADAVGGARLTVVRITVLSASVVAGCCFVGGVMLLALGPLLLRILIGSRYPATPMLFFWEMVVIGLMCAASVLRLGVLTLGHGARQLPIWVFAMAAFVGALAVPAEPMTKVVIGQLAAAGVAVVGLLVLLRRQRRSIMRDGNRSADVIAAK